MNNLGPEGQIEKKYISINQPVLESDQSGI